MEAGEIRKHRAGAEQFVLVLKDDGETVQFTLVHPYTEFATQHDAIVEPRLSGLPYSLVVQTDLRGVLFADELGAVVATLPSEVLFACLGIAVMEEVYFGPPMIGPLDSRWGFKVEQGETVRRLSSNALSKLLEESK